jgi:hypothetical protein
MAAFDDLDFPPSERERPTRVNPDPFGDSFFHEPSITAGNDEQFLPPRAAARRDAVRTRMKAEDLAARGIPFFKNASGGVSAVTDESGAALTNLDARHNIAYDSAGQPKLIAYGESGPPLLKDPFENIKPQTDPKTAAIEKYGPGGLYRYEGQDPVIAGQLERKARDKAIAQESTLLGRKLTLDEHDLRTGESDMKVMKNELRTQVPILLDPKYEGADRETVLGAIDQHFDTQYASPEANNTRGWFGRDLSPEANTRRQEIDQAKAKAREAANAIFDNQERLEGLRTTVDATREQERTNTETLLAHARGQQGPLDVPQGTGATPEGTTAKPTELYPPRKDWARMLGGDNAVEQMLGHADQGTIPPVAKPAMVAVAHDIQDAKAKAEALKDEDPGLARKFKNIATQLMIGASKGVIDILKGSNADPTWSTAIDPFKMAGLEGSIITSGLAHLAGYNFSPSDVRAITRAQLEKTQSQINAQADPVLKDTVAGKISNFAGGLVPFVAAALATKGKSVATPILAAMFYESGYQSTYEDAKAHGADDTKADLAAVGVGAINAVLALPLKVVGAPLQAIFGDTAPKVIQRGIEAAFQKGGAQAVYEQLARVATAIKTGAAPAGAKEEAMQGIRSVMAEITKTPGQRVATVAKTAATHAALGAGVQTSENVVKKTYNPDQGTFEGVPEAALAFGTLAGASEGFAQVIKARQAKKALDMIYPKRGPSGGPPLLGPGETPPGGGPGPTEKPANARVVSPTEGAADESVSKQRSQPQNKPAGGEPAATRAPAVEPSDAGGAKLQPVEADAGGKTASEAAVAKRNVVESGDTLAEGDKKFVVVSTGGKEGAGFVKVRPVDQPDAKPIVMGGAKVATRIANNELIHTKAAPASDVPVSSVDVDAHQAATSHLNALPEPSQAQKEAGNYQKGHVKVAGLDISIENPAGSRRKAEYRPLESHYGYIKGTVGADKDHVDIFIKQGTPTDYNGPVYVVNQVRKDGKFDEHKAVLGVHSKAEALAEYHKNYQPGWKGAGTVASFKNPEAFRQWATTGPKGQPAQSHGAEGLDHGTVLTHDSKAANEAAAKQLGLEYKGAWPGTNALEFKVPNDAKHPAAGGNFSVPSGATVADLEHRMQQKGEEFSAKPEDLATVKASHRVENLFRRQLKARQAQLTKLGHGTVKIGEVNTPSGIETRRDDTGKPQIYIDPKKMFETHGGLDKRAMVKALQRAADEEVLHVAFLTWEGKDSARTNEIKLMGAEKSELADHLAQTYPGWENLSDWQKGHEMYRAITQRRWTGRLTEAATRVIKAFLKYLRGVFEKLNPRQQQIVQEVEEMMGVTKERGPPAETKAPEKAIKSEKKAPKPSEIAIKSPETATLVTRANMTAEFAKANPEQAAMIQAAHNTAGSEARWAELRKTGASNERLLKAVSEEFGIQGGMSTPAGLRVDYHGGKNPRLELITHGTEADAKPNVQTIKGNALIALAREALQIPKEPANATETGKQQSSEGGELSRVPPRKNVRADTPEVRKKEGAKTDGGGSAVERAPASAPDVQRPVLDDKTKKAMQDAFKGLFAAVPVKHLGGKDKIAVALYKAGKPPAFIEEYTGLNEQQVQAAYQEALRPMRNVSSDIGDKASVAVIEKMRRDLGLGAGKPKSAPMGDLFSKGGVTEDLTLMGETALDGDAITKAKADAEERAIEAKKIADAAQGTLFAGRPPLQQKAIPAEKLAAFINLAQSLLERGVDTPEKLAAVMKADMDPRAWPFTQSLWNSMAAVRPELTGMHDWDAQYFPPKPQGEERQSKGRQDDGGFSDDPLISAIMDMGGLMSKSAGKKKLGERFATNQDLWDDVPQLSDPKHYSIYNPNTTSTPDEVLTALIDANLLPHDALVPDLWAAIDKASKSAKSMMRMQRDQRRQQDEAEAAATKQPVADVPEDPFGDLEPEPKPERLGGVPVTHVQSYTDENGILYELYRTPDKGGAIRAIDDSGNVIPMGIRLYPDYAKAEKEFILAISAGKLSNEGDDRSGTASVERDSGDSEPRDAGSSDRVQAGPGATDTDGTVDDFFAGGAPSPAAGGAVRPDVPAATPREPGDQPISEPASDLPERAAGSGPGPDSGGDGEPGPTPDTEREKLAAENLVEPNVSATLARSGDSGSTDLAVIQRVAPALQPEQAEDVLFVRGRLLDQKQPGALLTNGTGTGKTFSGLGTIKMALNDGAKHIAIIVPSDKIGSDWVKTAKEFFDIQDIAQLASTVDNAPDRRVVVTTYANFQQNDTLIKRPWDMIVTDESHYLSSAEGGEDTLALDALRALTWHPQGIYKRVKMLEPEATSAIHSMQKHVRKTGVKLTPIQLEQVAKYQEKIDATTDKVRAEFAAKTVADRPKVLFMSATPFAYRESIQYGNGYLFEYPKVERTGYNTPSPYGQFMIENFGYRMRTGKLTKPENATATGILERRFAERLMREGAMRGRALVVPFDYSRDFILTESQLGAKIDEIITKMMSTPRLRTLSKKIGVADYLQRRFILESLKAREAVPRIRQHIALGRKVVVFHDYKLGGSANPLGANLMGDEYADYTDDGGQKQRVRLVDAYRELQSHFPDWAETNRQLTGLRSPLVEFAAAFKEPGILGIFNGSVPKKERRRLANAFNEPKGEMKIFLAQRASAKEGISLHDTIGDEQRVFIDLGLPARPTDAIQSEGRIYRIGVKSNAVDEYLVTGTNFERWTFAQTIAQRASTAENLAMGEGARALLLSFAQGFNDAKVMAPHADQGKGGKEADAVRERGDPFKIAVALYYTNEKKTSRTKSREGIDYFATPEPVGFKMVEWAGILPGEKFLEPSAGHGAIAQFAPDATNRHAVEPSNELAGRLALNAPDTEIHEQRFEDFNIVNKFDVIAMNPPWGTAGKTAMEHLEKAANHLRDGGRLVALVPRGKMDDRLEKWLASEIEHETEGGKKKMVPNPLWHRMTILLPPVTFQRAGTSVSGQVIVIDKAVPSESHATGFEQRDLSSIDDIKELFNRLEHMRVPARPPKPEKPTDEQTEEDETMMGDGGRPEPETLQPLSPEHTAAKPMKPERVVDFVPAEFIHTKKGTPVYVAKTARRLSTDEFNEARVRAKRYDGYYSSFNGAGAIRGFHFKTAAARDAFLGVEGAAQRFINSETDAEGFPTKPFGESLGAAVPRVAADLYEEDVSPVLKKIGATMREVKNAVVRTLSPTTNVDVGATDATFKNLIGDRNKANFRIAMALRATKKMFDRMPRNEQVAFIDRMKRGQQQPTPELQQVAEMLREIDTQSWKAARVAYARLGFKSAEIPLSWMENHFRVLWKVIPGQTDEEKKEWIGKARRGLRGSMGQHKQHTLEDMSQGLDLGGVPYSYNPVVMFELAQADLWKLTTALNAWKWAKDNGFVEYVKGPFPKAPDGFVELDDSIARIYFPAASGEGLIQGGRFFVEEGFGRLLNNYLSQDYARRSQLGRSLLWLKNMTTSLELALSPFHAIFETLEAVGSNFGLGLTKLVNRGVAGGNAAAVLEGLRDMITAIATPVTHGLGKNSLGAQIKAMAADPDAFFATPEGKKMLRAYPGARDMINDLFDAGWKPAELEQDWRTNSIRAFVDSLSAVKSGDSHNYIGAAVRAFPAMNEMMMKPLFDHYIPRLKLAQFFKEYSEALAERDQRYGPAGYYIDRRGKRWEAPSRASLARQVWRFVEDRFGELNYDTLFWNRTFKSAMQLMFRSVTWKLGSVEAFGNAFAGQGKEFRDAFRERRAPELHRNMAWLFGMFVVTAALGIIIQKVLSGKDPESLTDLVFPRIDPKDDKVRVSLPTYFKDMIHLIHSPTSYVTASMSGWIGRVADLLRNKDYYGVQIRDTDDSITKQALQVGEYAGASLLPFSVRGYKNLSAQDVGGLRKALSLAGMNPAPRYISQTKAERQAEEYWRNQRAEGGIRPEQFEAKREKRAIVAKLQHGDDPNLSAALAKGAIKPSDIKALYQRASMGALQSMILHMPLEEAERLYKAATPKEQAELAGLMAKKRGNSAKRQRKMFTGF